MSFIEEFYKEWNEEKEELTLAHTYYRLWLKGRQTGQTFAGVESVRIEAFGYIYEHWDAETEINVVGDRWFIESKGLKRKMVFDRERRLRV